MCSYFANQRSRSFVHLPRNRIMLRTRMSRLRPAHAIDDAWRARVRRALEARGWEQIDLARSVKCSPSVISELLAGKKNQSPYVPDIHLALGWTPPLPPVLPEET